MASTITQSVMQVVQGQVQPETIPKRRVVVSTKVRAETKRTKEPAKVALLVSSRFYFHA